jgi:formiminotetrahydrofolate cyclodeaminase
MILSQQELQITDPTSILERPTNQLLNDFGAGRASPGSGSAAALLSLLSSKMILTVCDISLRKDECNKTYKEFQFITKTVQGSIEPRLKKTFRIRCK